MARKRAMRREQAPFLTADGCPLCGTKHQPDTFCFCWGCGHRHQGNQCGATLRPDGEDDDGLFRPEREPCEGQRIYDGLRLLHENERDD